MSEFLRVAREILELEQKPMRAMEIVSAAIKHGLFSDKRAGKTPYQTMKSKLSVYIRRRGDASEFVRTEAGKFYLRHLLTENQQVYHAPPYRPKTEEQVLVFRSDLLENGGRFQGIKKSPRDFFHRILSGDVCKYVDRIQAEKDESNKQVITYIMVTRGSSVLAYKRGYFSRVEDYLKGSHCIGFGGHVTQADLDLFSSNDMGVTRSVARELSEELKLPEIDQQRLQKGIGLKAVGVLNDDSSIVGRRHIGLLFRYEVSDNRAWDKPERGEKAITQLRWIGNESEPVPIWQFEYWSQLCLREFFSNLVNATPAFRILRRAPLKPPHLLCVLGTVGSGKSEATKVLSRDFGYAEVNTGKLVADLLSIPPVPKTKREVFQKKAWKFIQKKKGPQMLAEAIWRKVKELDNPKILVDGIRQKATFQELCRLAGRRRIGLLYVHTLPDIAFKFYKRREGNGISIHDFLRLRDASVELEVGEMIESSDAILYNWTGRLRYQNVIRSLMQKLTV